MNSHSVHLGMVDGEATQTVVPHPGIARVLSRRTSMDRIEATLLRCLERLHEGLVILDDSNRVEFANAAARRAFHGRTSISIRRNRLQTTDDRLASLLAPERRQPATKRGSWTLELRDPHLPPATQSILVSVQSGRRSADPLVLHLVVPREARIVAAGALREVFGLTAAEAALVSQLVAGNDLADAADELTVSVHTARTHLKKVFHKCKVRSQAELMRLVMSFPEEAI